MDQIALTVFVPQSVALKAGSSRYGMATLPLTDEQLAELSLEQREWLAPYLADSGPRRESRKQLELPTPDTSWPAVRATIEADMALEAAERAEAAARKEARVIEALALPSASWFVHSEYRAPELRSIESLVWDGREDPRLLARRAELEPELLRLQAEWTKEQVTRYCALPLAPRVGLHGQWEQIKADPRAQEHHARMVAIETEEAARSEAREAAVRAELRAWAVERIDHLARAAAEGYDVEGAVVTHVVEQIRKSIVGGAGVMAKDADVVTIVEDTPDWDRHSWAERSAPHARVLLARDAVVAAVARVERPSCFAIEVLRAMRIEVEDSDGDEGRKFTGIVVAIECPITKQHAIVVDVD